MADILSIHYELKYIHLITKTIIHIHCIYDTFNMSLTEFKQYDYWRLVCDE